MNESITLTLDVATCRRLDSLARAFNAEYADLERGDVTRAVVLREALLQGLALLERQTRAGGGALTASVFSDASEPAEKMPRAEAVADRIVRSADDLWYCVWIERDSVTGWHRVVASPFRSAENGGLDTLEDAMPDGVLVWDTHEPLSSAAAQVIFEDWVRCLEDAVDKTHLTGRRCK